MMILEKQLIEKKYYETFLKDGERIHPVQALGEEYYKELGNEDTELAYIRFAQGEVYYQNKDFESAIFKWEQVENDLQDWAKKNIADSLFELGKLVDAEEKYKSITTESISLTIEILLQLFSLYIIKEEYPKADEIIKQAVKLAPDYPNVTSVAKVFYEKHQDWNSAVELAVTELIRTEAVYWADILKQYVEDNHLSAIEPNYFTQVLLSLYKVADERFKMLVVSFWENFRRKETYISWIETVNQVFSQIEVHPYESWHIVVHQYLDSYRELLAGTRFIKIFKHVMPIHLENWLKLSDSSESLFASSALLAWEQAFPSSINEQMIQYAEQLMYESGAYEEGLQDSLHLVDDIITWAEQKNVNISYKWKWYMQQLLDFNSHYVTILGMKSSGKEAILNTILGEMVENEPSSNITYFRDDTRTFAQQITDENEEDYVLSNNTIGNSIIDYHLPNRFLNRNNVVLIDMPTIQVEKEEGFNKLSFSDTILYVLHAHMPFTDQERDNLLYIEKIAPHTHIHFLVNKAEILLDNLEELKESIHSYFPNAAIIPFTKEGNISDIANCFINDYRGRDLLTERTGQLLRMIRNLLTYILRSRVEEEKAIAESITWNDELVVKLNGFINNVVALEKEKSINIFQSYKDIKDKISSLLSEQIPKILKESSNLVSIDSDFKELPKQLNDNMNERIQNYVNEHVMPIFVNQMLNWIHNTKEELITSQDYLDETKETFNTLYEQDRLILQCDFKVLDDWRRDVDRIMRRVRIDQMNIMLKYTTTQFVLTSTGRLFGGFERSKTMLSNQFKNYVEQKDYTEITDAVIRRFFAEFELFERGIEQDVALFYRDAIGELKRTVEETHIVIQQNRDTLNEMKANPETYHDPITLFEIQLRQQEMIWNVGKFPKAAETPVDSL
ncbi:GTP-binding protein [Ectobacillus polymachus]|uniref:GTP-binding protein n=1 Tax=Ectobacillus polymachus TaxID=1508806 RepID=UPI003A859078